MRVPLQTRYQPLVFALMLCNIMAVAQSRTTTWTGTGKWTSATHWNNGLPSVFTNASLLKQSDVTIPRGNFTVARLAIGTERGDHVQASLNGGHLLVRQDSLIIGEYTGGSAEFNLNAGLLESVMDIFVGGATASTGRMNRSLLNIRGGNLIGLSLTIGEGLGSQSTVAIFGSKPATIQALEFLTLHAEADPSGTPGRTTLAFTLDEHGVTPVSISSRFSGLRIEHDAISKCLLQINLSAIPPREDITLIESRAPNRGEFSNMPEGAVVEANFAGHTYTWQLTYRGGNSGHDVVLHNTSTYPPNASITHVRTPPHLLTPSWYGHPVHPLAVSQGTPAFTGAEGYGAYSKGGRAGRTVTVDNLNDAGPGSLRAALEASGARIVQFHIAGDIVLRSPIVIRHPYLTFNGSSAPAPGITLRHHGLEVQTHDVVLRYFRIRIGDKNVRKGVRYGSGDGEYALDFTEGASNGIADHLSLSWSTNKILSTTKFADRITIQWCILSEALNLDHHGYASIVGGNRVTWHHNLFAHNFGRNPRFQGSVDADFRNNVVYDWGETAGYGEFDRVNYAGNYLKPGPSTTQQPQLFLRGTEVVAPHSLYFANNVLEGNSKATQNNWLATGFYFDRENIAAAHPFPAPAISFTSAATAYTDVLSKAGATLPARDSTDSRLLKEVRTGTGHIIQSTEELR